MRIDDLIIYANNRKASDIHLIFGLPPKCRVAGELESMADFVLNDEDCNNYAIELARYRYDDFLEIGEMDLASTIQGVRVRINLFRQQEHTSIVIRLLNDKIPRLDCLGLPLGVERLTELKRGIVIVTGQTGSGKSTTLASLIDRINHTRSCHVITLEDPIEYIYEPDLCIFNQREVGRDTKSYETGLRSVLREDPDVILIGEMRDTITMETALKAAETGHLVLTTLHTGSASEAVDRIVDAFPEAKQQQIRLQLSMTLMAVLSQQLIPMKDGKGLIPACEFMLINPAIRNLIREGKTPQIDNVISTTADKGSITMDNAIIKLYREKKISSKTALLAARNLDFVKKNIT
ncbi:type IV pilus twitching motility protein PilT [Anaerotignum sp.]|uniref:type IV pilus twitching motility protein PilT n=1 Tax=Anaerotignum sp. TaxID=2039241 RepID=UPI0028AD82A6|nr:PilT/PilU family type 4a pilus ATPase [Anaerotignum sp.]